MPCHAAMNKKFVSVQEETSVEKALATMKKGNVTEVPVVDDEGVFQGVFSLKKLFENLLPVSVSMADGVQLDVTLAAAPGVAKRLKKVKPLLVRDFMMRKVPRVAPGAPLWEGMQAMIGTHGCAILPVVDPDSGKLLGLINTQSMMNELERLSDE